MKMSKEMLKMPQFVKQLKEKKLQPRGLGDLNNCDRQVIFQLVVAQIEQVSTHSVNENFTGSGPLAAQ